VLSRTRRTETPEAQNDRFSFENRTASACFCICPKRGICLALALARAVESRGAIPAKASCGVFRGGCRSVCEASRGSQRVESSLATRFPELFRFIKVTVRTSSARHRQLEKHNFCVEKLTVASLRACVPPSQAKTDAFEATASGGHDVSWTSGMLAAANFKQLLAKFEVSPWLLDPRSKRMKNWDAAVAVALIYTATLTPYEVAFVDTKPGPKLDPSLSSFPIYVINL